VPSSPLLFLGTAAWSIPVDQQPRFPAGPAHLARYSQLLRGVEINTSFRKPHRNTVYEKWAAASPPWFRFAVKIPQRITHELHLEGAEVDVVLDEFLGQVSGLGEKLGPLLVQLPPKLEFDGLVANAFFANLRQRVDSLPGERQIVCEPRHASWFGAAPHALLARHRIARVAADPARVPDAAIPGGWDGLVYYRLHGSPRTYYSAYEEPFLTKLAGEIRGRAAGGVPVWCVFDNTAAGAATGNVLDLCRQIG
jgi:uncharacterized protein YecE (DUF72 family)